MEFSEISELNRFVGFHHKPFHKYGIQTFTQYNEYVRDFPIENLIYPSPWHIPKSIKSRENQDPIISDSNLSDFRSKSESDLSELFSNESSKKYEKISAPRFQTKKEIIREILDSIINNVTNKLKSQPKIDTSFNLFPYKSHRCYSVMTILMQNCKEQRSKSAVYIVPPLETDPRRQNLTVYVLNTKRKLKITISKDNTISQIISHIFYMCLYGNNEITLPYDNCEGYEMRMVDDDEILYEIAPLENKKEIGSYRIDIIAFCAKQDYVPKSHKKISIFF